MSRNVDLIAIAALLLGFAVYSQIRHAVVIAVNAQRVTMQPYTHTFIVPPVPDAPRVCPVPHFRIMRD